ncbi:beta-1,4-galactosyltransferase [Candidatus Micrarchaeota archaeon]|nr:beta-1,4-galactosyltransferase [Candidatus Micrarchaeota archaeon]
MKIFVTIGTALPFDRLIKELDDVTGKNKWTVNAQIGNSTCEPNNFKATFQFLKPSDLKKEIDSAEVVVMHAGVGTILDLINIDRKCVLVPRLKQFGEAVDDHQLQICKELEKQGAVVCYDMENLEKSIKKAKPLSKIDPKEYKQLKSNINKYIDSFI